MDRLDLAGLVPQQRHGPGSGGPDVTYDYATRALGTITLPGGPTVYVTLTGEIVDWPGASGFGIPGSDYWSSRPFTGSGEAYTSTNVPDLPTNSDRIAVSGSVAGGGVALQTLEFFSDEARTVPITMTKLVMNIYSLGRPGQGGEGLWNFTRDFDVLSDNAPPVSVASGFTKGDGGPPYTLSAFEGSGTLQFLGGYQSVSWTVVNPEFYAAWSIGVTTASAPSDPTYAIAYDDAGATTPSSGGAASYTSGVPFALPTPPARTGFTFAGWQVTGAVTPTSVAADALTVTLTGSGEVTLTARWTPIGPGPDPVGPGGPAVPRFTG